MTVELDKGELQLICTLLDQHKEQYMTVDDEMICRMRRMEGRCNVGDCDDSCEHHLFSDRYITYLANLIEKLEP